MDVGAAVHASDLTLPSGVRLQVEPDTLVLHVIARQAAEEPEEAAEGGVPEAPRALGETAEGSGQEQAG
jgi:large subunit ribosomal protein L25